MNPIQAGTGVQDLARSQTKAEAESWFSANIKGQIESLGHKISWVKGDKFQFTNWQGTFTVDFVRGADGPNPAFQWGVE